jgi:polyisoprenoid-binding protein YceI
LLPRRFRALFITLLAALAILAADPQVCAAEDLFVDLDPGKTQIAFTVSDTLHTVHGTFRLKEGHFRFEPNGTAISGDITVDAGSGDSGSAARDKRMTRDVLQAQRFPEIHFRPSRKSGAVAASGKSDVEVIGSFFIHGESHEITVPMHIEISGSEFVVKGTFLVPYVEWGMKSPSNFLIKVNDKVKIDLAAQGHFKGSAP